MPRAQALLLVTAPGQIRSRLRCSSCNSITAPVPAGKALIVLSVTVNINAASNLGPVTVSVTPAKPGSPCTQLVPSGSANISSRPGQGSSENIPFPQGLPIEAGHGRGRGEGLPGVFDLLHDDRTTSRLLVTLR